MIRNTPITQSTWVLELTGSSVITFHTADCLSWIITKNTFSRRHWEKLKWVTLAHTGVVFPCLDMMTAQVFTCRSQKVSFILCSIFQNEQMTSSLTFSLKCLAEAGLSVSSQNVSGYEGGNVTIRCHGASHWCTIGGSCVGGDGVFPERTAVSDDGGVLNVTLWPLQKEDSGWYYCSNDVSQMPVYVTVMEAQDFTQFTTNSSQSNTSLQADRSVHVLVESEHQRWTDLNSSSFHWFLLCDCFQLGPVAARSGSAAAHFCLRCCDADQSKKQKKWVIQWFD